MRLRRNQLVHTPCGWGVVDELYDRLDDRCEWQSGVMVTLEAPEGDEPEPRWFALHEVEPEAEPVEVEND